VCWCWQFKLLTYLKHKFEAKHRVSVERVISGPGIANV
jgi:glucokinase